ncbi:hypothetical protein CEXT_217231 [Caerostris extrusa]|uniref:Uncharacterized protein n=1 Tax=Caerostris extrusa TaxID=172846 RepID=A0AAV4UF96_CAEEX|nr:hypothetical protein CEXT_217231 [Caerostris extrusa]
MAYQFSVRNPISFTTSEIALLLLKAAEQRTFGAITFPQFVLCRKLRYLSLIPFKLQMCLETNFELSRKQETKNKYFADNSIFLSKRSIGLKERKEDQKSKNKKKHYRRV